MFWSYLNYICVFDCQNMQFEDFSPPGIYGWYTHLLLTFYRPNDYSINLKVKCKVRAVIMSILVYYVRAQLCPTTCYRHLA